MNNMLMQRIVDEVVFRLKQRAGKTLVLTVFQLRDASVQEIAWGLHIQLSLQCHFLNAIELKTLARLPLSWCDEQGQPIYLHRDRLLSYADIAQLSSGILVLQRKCCVTALAREAAITRNIQLIRQE